MTSPEGNRNIEIKARVNSLSHVRAIAAEIATDYVGVMEQTDTFFHCPNGRLKVREVPGRRAELIAYHRADSATARSSDYTLVQIDDSSGLIAALKRTLGVRQIVRKRREVFLHHNVRIHLDEVERLGEFVELESVVSAGVDEATAMARLNELMARFDIHSDDLLAGAYADMLAENA